MTNDSFAKVQRHCFPPFFYNTTMYCACSLHRDFSSSSKKKFLQEITDLRRWCQGSCTPGKIRIRAKNGKPDNVRVKEPTLALFSGGKIRVTQEFLGQIGTMANCTLKKSKWTKSGFQVLSFSLSLTLRHYFGSDEQIFGGFYCKKKSSSSAASFTHTRGWRPRYYFWTFFWLLEWHNNEH